MAASKKTGGLAGVTAGKTEICTVGKEGAGLTYRGYDIYDLVDNASFEEVAYLLLHGKLPTRAELDAYIARLVSLRGLPDEAGQSWHVAFEWDHACPHQAVLQFGRHSRLLYEQALGLVRDRLQQVLETRQVIGRLGERSR